MFPIIIAFDSIYFVLPQIFNYIPGIRFRAFFLYVIINLIGSNFIYKPIDHLFLTRQDNIKVRKRINHIALYSSLLVFLLATCILHFLLPLYFFPNLFSNPEDFIIEKIPPEFFLFHSTSDIFYLCALSFLHCLFFLVNDFKIDLKETISREFNMLLDR